MTDYLLKVEGLTKCFPGVKALDGVQLEVGRGEVHALLGENGCGKSTFLKTLSGAQAPDKGVMLFNGKRLDNGDGPIKRQLLGIVTIYQEFNLLPAMSVAENMFVGREPLKNGWIKGWIDWRRMHADAQRLIDQLGLDLNSHTEVRRLSVAQQQMVEIAKALTLNAKLIIMDEPSAALSEREVETLHTIIRDLRARGVGIIYVTHRLKEVKQICDRYTVLRGGRYIESGAVSDIQIEGIVRLMIGRDLIFTRRQQNTRSVGEEVLYAESVSRVSSADNPHAAVLSDLSVKVHRSEIVGFAGLVGAGRTELARILFGADRCDEGVIYLHGKTISPLLSPADGIRAGITLVPEDRKQQGCFLTQSVRQNMTLPSLKRLTKWKLFVDRKAETALVEMYRQKLNIQMPNDTVLINTLSGGNQQKVLLARCMALKPKLLIVDEPTRGIDIGAKAEVHQLLFEMANDGVALIVISSELPEILAVSDRIITFREGRITGMLDATDADEEKLMALMAIGEMLRRPAAMQLRKGNRYGQQRRNTFK